MSQKHHSRMHYYSQPRYTTSTTASTYLAPQNLPGSTVGYSQTTTNFDNLLAKTTYGGQCTSGGEICIHINCTCKNESSEQLEHDNLLKYSIKRRQIEHSNLPCTCENMQYMVRNQVHHCPPPVGQDPNLSMDLEFEEMVRQKRLKRALAQKERKKRLGSLNRKIVYSNSIRDSYSRPGTYRMGSPTSHVATNYYNRTYHHGQQDPAVIVRNSSSRRDMISIRDDSLSGAGSSRRQEYEVEDLTKTRSKIRKGTKKRKKSTKNKNINEDGSLERNEDRKTQRISKKKVKKTKKRKKSTNRKQKELNMDKIVDGVIAGKGYRLSNGQNRKYNGASSSRSSLYSQEGDYSGDQEIERLAEQKEEIQRKIEERLRRLEGNRGRKRNRGREFSGEEDMDDDDDLFDDQDDDIEYNIDHRHKRSTKKNSSQRRESRRSRKRTSMSREGTNSRKKTWKASKRGRIYDDELEEEEDYPLQIRSVRGRESHNGREMVDKLQDDIEQMLDRQDQRYPPYQERRGSTPVYKLPDEEEQYYEFPSVQRDPEYPGRINFSQRNRKSNLRAPPADQGQETGQQTAPHNSTYSIPIKERDSSSVMHTHTHHHQHEFVGDSAHGLSRLVQSGLMDDPGLEVREVGDPRSSGGGFQSNRRIQTEENPSNKRERGERGDGGGRHRSQMPSPNNLTGGTGYRHGDPRDKGFRRRGTTGNRRQAGFGSVSDSDDGSFDVKPRHNRRTQQKKQQQKRSNGKNSKDYYPPRGEGDQTDSEGDKTERVKHRDFDTGDINPEDKTSPQNFYKNLRKNSKHRPSPSHPHNNRNINNNDDDNNDQNYRPKSNGRADSESKAARRQNSTPRYPSLEDSQSVGSEESEYEEVAPPLSKHNTGGVSGLNSVDSGTPGRQRPAGKGAESFNKRSTFGKKDFEDGGEAGNIADLSNPSKRLGKGGRSSSKKKSQDSKSRSRQDRRQPPKAQQSSTKGKPNKQKQQDKNRKLNKKNKNTAKKKQKNDPDNIFKDFDIKYNNSNSNSDQDIDDKNSDNGNNDQEFDRSPCQHAKHGGVRKDGSRDRDLRSQNNTFKSVKGNKRGKSNKESTRKGQRGDKRGQDGLQDPGVNLEDSFDPNIDNFSLPFTDKKSSKNTAAPNFAFVEDQRLSTNAMGYSASSKKPFSGKASLGKLPLRPDHQQQQQQQQQKETASLKIDPRFSAPLLQQQEQQELEGSLDFQDRLPMYELEQEEEDTQEFKDQQQQQQQQQRNTPDNYRDPLLDSPFMQNADQGRRHFDRNNPLHMKALKQQLQEELDLDNLELDSPELSNNGNYHNHHPIVQKKGGKFSPIPITRNKIKNKDKDNNPSKSKRNNSRKRPSGQSRSSRNSSRTPKSGKHQSHPPKDKENPQDRLKQARSNRKGRPEAGPSPYDLEDDAPLFSQEGVPGIGTPETNFGRPKAPKTPNGGDSISQGQPGGTGGGGDSYHMQYGFLQNSGPDSLRMVDPSLNTFSQILPDDNSVPDNNTPQRMRRDAFDKSRKTIGGRNDQPPGHLEQSGNNFMRSSVAKSYQEPGMKKNQSSGQLPKAGPDPVDKREFYLPKRKPGGFTISKVPRFQQVYTGLDLDTWKSSKQYTAKDALNMKNQWGEKFL